jgi:tetratricopeptide (TPR) repeat protein
MNLACLFAKVGYLDLAVVYMERATKSFESLSWLKRRSYRDLFLGQRSLFKCATGQYDAVEDDHAQARGREIPSLTWAQAKVHLHRRDFPTAELLLRKSLEYSDRVNASFHPGNLDIYLDLAEAQFGQAKHDDAFASLQEARDIVAEFALPADDTWRKALATWRQRAGELGRADLAASLDAELALATEMSEPGIKILERFRVQDSAPSD